MCELSPVQLGTVLFSMLEPVLGHEVELNRWYERDPFYASMACANYFSGKRWIATRRLKDLRYPLNTPISTSIDKGSFIAIYWTLAGQEQSVMRALAERISKRTGNDRVSPPRENISTAFYQYCWGVFRDEHGVPAELALEHPYRGLSVMMIDRDESVSDGAFQQFCQDNYLPKQMQKSPIAMTLCLKPQSTPADVLGFAAGVSETALSRRYLLLSFLEQHPQQCWSDRFANVDIDMRGSGIGDVVYAAPFIPTVPGTNKYLDQL